MSTDRDSASNSIDGTTTLATVVDLLSMVGRKGDCMEDSWVFHGTFPSSSVAFDAQITTSGSIGSMFGTPSSIYLPSSTAFSLVMAPMSLTLPSTSYTQKSHMESPHQFIWIGHEPIFS